jgi:uncharacterized membrane protein
MSMPKGWTSGRTNNKPLEDNIPEADYAQYSLKGMEAYTRDVGRRVARIDYDSMDDLNVSTGDVIEIKGKRRTVVKCLPLYPSDEGKGIIRIDGLDRNNTATEIGDTISIRKIKAVPAEKVILAPLEAIPPIDERYLADALESVPVIKGDNVMVPYFGGRLTFQVIGVTPAADAVLINQKTVFHIAEKKEEPAEKEEAPAEKDEIPTTDDPMNILKLRLAKGEITIEEYKKIKEILE